MATPLMELPREVRRMDKARLVAGMNEGLSWREAAAAADITVREDTAYRLRTSVLLNRGLPSAWQALYLEQEIERFLGITDKPVASELRK